MSQPIELLRIEHDPATQQLRVYLSGQSTRVEDIADLQLRAHIQAILQRLQPPALSAPPVPTPVSEALPTPPTAPDAPLPETPPAMPPPPAEELRAPFLTRLRDSLRPGYKAPPLTVARGAKDESTSATATMFAQIDHILQRRRLEQGYATPLEIIGEGGELHIKYGNQIYLQVDAVPDERARTLIHEAVKEWEAM